MTATAVSGVKKGSARPPSGPGRRRPRSHRGLTLGALAAPSLVLMLVVNAYPLGYAVVESFHGGNLINRGPFVGADNFARAVTDPAFWRAARFTAIFTLAGVLGSWMVGLAFALVLNRPFPGRAVFRVLLLLPWIVPTVVSSMSWNWLTATDSSLLPQLAQWLGFGNVLFLADPVLAQVTVCLFKVWISFPFMMVMSAAALEGIDENVYEAAQVDGASAQQRLFHLTLPLIARSTYISWILMAMFSINDFPTIFLLTGGGPVDATTSLVVLAYRTVFQSFQTGYGIAIAMLMTIVVVTVSVTLYRRVQRAEAG